MRSFWLLLILTSSLASLGCPVASSKAVNKDYDRPKTPATK
ncbi:MAG: hypothetical protein ACRC8S_21945 [Fimbriiglobus sp.]